VSDIPGLYYPENHLDILTAPEADSWKTGFSRFDSILGGIRPCEVTLLTGRPGSGKTTFTNDVILRLIAQYPDMRVFVASLELRFKTFCSWLCRTAGMIPGLESYHELFNILEGRLAVYAPSDVPGVGKLLGAMNEVSKRGIELVIIDSLMCVRLGRAEDTLENQRLLMARLNAYAAVNQAHVILIAHPRKGYNDAARVDMVDISGSADLANLAWNVLGMHRGTDTDGRDTAECFIRILKNRERGRRGVVAFKHHDTFQRFQEV
jgi:replicative DNA helicase